MYCILEPPLYFPAYQHTFPLFQNKILNICIHPAPSLSLYPNESVRTHSIEMKIVHQEAWIMLIRNTLFFLIHPQIKNKWPPTAKGTTITTRKTMASVNHISNANTYPISPPLESHPRKPGSVLGAAKLFLYVPD